MYLIQFATLAQARTDCQLRQEAAVGSDYPVMTLDSVQSLQC